MKRSGGAFMVLFLMCSTVVVGQNLLTGPWSNGSPDNFGSYSVIGSSGQNSIVDVAGPFGANVESWRWVTEDKSGANGGWMHAGINLNTSKSYRYTVWMKSNGPQSCNRFAGHIPYEPINGGDRIHPIDRVGGSTSTYPNAMASNIPDGTWFLLVTYIHPSNFQGQSAGALYDVSLVDPNNPSIPTPGGTTVIDFKMPSSSNYSTINARFRSLTWSCGGGEEMLTYDPRVEELGTEVPLLSLLAPNAGNNVPVTGIQVNPTSVNLAVGASSNITGSVLPNNATDQRITWSSGNNSVATVNGSGQITAISVGSTTVTATSDANPSLNATVSVTVTDNGGGTPPTGGGETVWTSGSNNTIYYNSGNIGIGTTNPREKLQIGNSIAFHDGGHQVIAFKQASGGVDLDASKYAGELRFDPVNGKLRLGTSATLTDSPSTRMTIDKNGNVGIGTTTPDEKLAVNGSIHAREVRVDLIGWPDYVFTNEHELPTLEEVQKHIQEKGHLPNIPSAKEVEENGVQLGEMNKLLLEKIEELTLYVIGLKAENETLKSRVEILENE